MGVDYMTVSFLVTFYNQKEYVKQSLDSILEINKPCDWEILIGDDGSSDGTIDEVRKYVSLYPDNIKLYIMPRKQGEKYDPVKRASANRLNLLEHSKGNLFCTLDGDDYFCDREFIREAVEIFGNDNKISVVAFGFKYVGDTNDKRTLTLPEKFKNRCVDRKEFLKKYYIHAGGCVYKKCFDDERINYIKKLGYYDDNNIVVNNLNYGEIFAVNRIIYAYRQTGKSVYTSMDEVEQAVLNVQGMDVDIRLVSPDWKEAIEKRYASAVILMFIWRKRIKEVLGNEKYHEYESGCTNLMPSYCYDLLHYNEMEYERLKIIKKILKMQKKYTLIQYIRYWLATVEQACLNR